MFLGLLLEAVHFLSRDRGRGFPIPASAISRVSRDPIAGLMTDSFLFVIWLHVVGTVLQQSFPSKPTSRSLADLRHACCRHRRRLPGLRIIARCALVDSTAVAPRTILGVEKDCKVALHCWRLDSSTSGVSRSRTGVPVSRQPVTAIAALIKHHDLFHRSMVSDGKDSG